MTEADKIIAAAMRAGELWARQVGDHLLGEAQREAPILHGALRASGHVTIDVTGLGVEVTVSFDEVYAARQHEETGWQHPKGGGAKYLERPLKENLARYERTLWALQSRELG